MAETEGPVNLMRLPDNAVMSRPGEAEEPAREGGNPMGNPSPKQRREDREKMSRVTEQLKALEDMSIAELAARFQELTGREARSRNRSWLRKRLAWQLQESEFGGLTADTLAKIEELKPLATKLFDPLTRKGRRASNATVPAVPRDPRLPEPGGVLRRSFGGTVHEVTVLTDGFDYDGRHFRSLSNIARQITGTPWNGFTFFGCNIRKEVAR